MSEKLMEKKVSPTAVVYFACYNHQPALVDMLLAKKKLSDEEIDKSVKTALHMLNMDISDKLMSLKPAQTPLSDAYIAENIYAKKAESQYTTTIWWDIMFHDAIVDRHDLVFDLMYKHLKKIEWRDLKEALQYNYLLPITNHLQRTYQTNNMHVIQRLMDRDFLMKLGYLNEGKVTVEEHTPLGYLIHLVLQDAFENNNQEVIDYIHKNYADVLGRMSIWTIRSAAHMGRNDEVMRFLKTDEEFSDGLAVAAEFGNTDLAKRLMAKIENSSKEPDALDYALAQAIYHLKDGVNQKTIQGMLWKRILALKNKKLEATIMAAIESDNSSLDYLKMILENTKYNVNFIYGFVTPLIKAIVANDIGMVRFLLEYGANPNLPGKRFTLGYPLTFAILQFVKYEPSSERGGFEPSK